VSRVVNDQPFSSFAALVPPLREPLQRIAYQAPAPAAPSKAARELVALVAHELRGPIGVLRTSATLLERSELDEQQRRKLLDAVKRQTTLLAKLVDGMLDTSRMERGTLDVDKRPLDLGALLQELCDSMIPAFTAKGVRMTVAIPPEPVLVCGDDTRLVQVFTNLLENARKYTGLGGTVHLEMEVDEGFIRIAVRDTGAGIACDKLDRIFNAYEQADASRDQALGGLGLGLAVVKGLVELHGGSVKAVSDGPGRGSTFIVELPAYVPS
jgi:signal transduction histidine kinase